MHIKHIHDIVEKLSEFAKCELDKGIEQVDTKEMGEVAEIIKELSEAEYYAKISKAMDKLEYGEDYDYLGAYDEHERKGYRGQPKDSRGRYMSRRGYESRMIPNMDLDEMEYNRDMDRDTHNRMYYSDNTGTISSKSESRYDKARKGYKETKEMQDHSPEGKKKTMESLENYMKELGEDMSELVGQMDASEKTMLKSKLQTLAQKIS